MEKKKGKEIDTREDKLSRIATGIAMKSVGETTTPTNLAKGINVHYSTLIDNLEAYDTLREVDFRVIRDAKGKIRAIIKTDESLETRKEMRDFRKEILEIKNTLDDIKTKLFKK